MAVSAALMAARPLAGPAASFPAERQAPSPVLLGVKVCRPSPDPRRLRLPCLADGAKAVDLTPARPTPNIAHNGRDKTRPDL